MIRKILLQNWMGHEELEVDFTTGSNLIYGKNASGKSSIAKAIAFGLAEIKPYTEKRIKNKKVINDWNPRRNNKKEAIVDIHITINKTKYLLRRIVKKSKAFNFDSFLYEQSNLAVPKFEGEKVSEFIFKQLGLSQSIFSRITYMKEEDVHEFLANPSGSVIFEIDKLTGLDQIKSLKDAMYTSKKKLEKKSRDKYELIGKESYKKESSELEEKVDIEDIKKKLSENSVTIENLEKLNELLAKKEKLDIIVENYKELFKEQNIKKIEAIIIKKQVELQNKTKKIEQEFEELNKSHNIEKNNQHRIDAKLSLNKKIHEDILLMKKERKFSDCPTCGRKMDNALMDETLKKIDKENKELEKTIKVVQRKISDFENKNSILMKKKSKINDEIENLKQQKERFSTEIGEFLEINKKIAELRKKNYSLSIPLNKDEIENLKKENIDLDYKRKHYEKDVQRIDSKILELKQNKEKNDYFAQIAGLIEIASQRTAKLLRTQNSAEVKKNAEKFWELYKGGNWIIDWDDNFIPKASLVNSDKTLFAYEMSGSERFLLLLAIRIAFQQSLDQLQLLIIDEPCQHLDETSGTVVRDILTLISEEKISQSIIFTYNKEYLKGKWSNIRELT